MCSFRKNNNNTSRDIPTGQSHDKNTHVCTRSRASRSKGPERIISISAPTRVGAESPDLMTTHSAPERRPHVKTVARIIFSILQWPRATPMSSIRTVLFFRKTFACASDPFRFAGALATVEITAR